MADSPGFEFSKIGLLGGGRMAEAILAGVVKEELLDPSKIVVYDVNRERLDYLKRTFGVTPASSVAATCATDLTVVCVKPQNLPSVWGAMRKHLKPTSVLLSIVAGGAGEVWRFGMGQREEAGKAGTHNPTQIKQRHAHPHRRADERLHRAGRHLPRGAHHAQHARDGAEGHDGCVYICLSCSYTFDGRACSQTTHTHKCPTTVWCCSDDVSKAQRDSVAKFLSSLGEQHYVQDESYLDMATAVSGSGPGYVLVGGVGCMHVCLCFTPPKKRYHTDGWIYVHRPRPSTITTITGDPGGADRRRRAPGLLAGGGLQARAPDGLRDHGHGHEGTFVCVCYYHCKAPSFRHRAPYTH